MTRVAFSAVVIVIILFTVDIFGSSPGVPQPISSAELASIRGGKSCYSLSMPCCPFSNGYCNCCVFKALCGQCCGACLTFKTSGNHYKAARCNPPGNTGLIPCLPPQHCGCMFKCRICKFGCVLGNPCTPFCCLAVCFPLNITQTQPCGCTPECPM